VIVYVDKNKPGIAVPKVINGVRTLVIPTDAASVSAGTAPTTLNQTEGIHLPAEVLRAAAAVQRQSAPQLMADPAFFGVGVTQSYDNPAEAALLVLVDLTKTPAVDAGCGWGFAAALHARQSPARHAVETRSRAAGVSLRTSAGDNHCHAIVICMGSGREIFIVCIVFLAWISHQR
jgi:hypothetical protein